LKISISGIRGIYGQDLNLQEVDRFSRLFAGSIKSGKCVVARDTRPSGRIISQVVAAGLMSQGINVYDLGIAPTPAVFREARNFGSGVIITASHNPLEWNGLKFVVEGRGLFEDELEAMLKQETKYAGRFGHEYAASSSYVDDIAQLTKSDSRVSVGIDSGGGAACGYAERLFKNLGHEYYGINGIRGVSSRGPDPTADPLDDLRSLVVSKNLDHAFALDLDADRLVVVSDKGEKLNPDATLLLCVARAIELGIRGQVSHSKVGEANVVKKMLENNAEAGGEGSSAGFIMPKFTMCRDGLLAAATISTLKPQTIRESMEFASQFAQVRSKIEVHSSQHAAVIGRLEQVLKTGASSVITGDGIKAIVDEYSWILIRPSNTEHAIRISVESKAAKVQQLYSKAKEKVQSVYDQIK
jgi:phosphomannomutase